jgi:hypothetical protein
MNNNGINECCKNADNLKEIERKPVTYADGGDAGVLVTRHCEVCGRKHYEHQVKPLHVGVTPKHL